MISKLFLMLLSINLLTTQIQSCITIPPIEESEELDLDNALYHF